MNKTEKIIAAIASFLVFMGLFTPIWQILLFAPQYPGGLTMYISHNKLGGDVDTINGLNHYIGMKVLKEEDFPEFQYLGWIIGGLGLMGLATAMTGRVWLLYAFCVGLILLAVAGIVDFAIWLDAYSSNLDPKAPLDIGVLSPPIIGKKTIVNFEVHSYPALGGALLIMAGVLALVLALRRMRKPSASLAFLALAFWHWGCNVGPVAIKYGKDTCAHCRMMLTDPKFGCEIVTAKGRVFIFDDLNCMVGFMKKENLKEADVSHKVVINYLKTGEFIDVDSAVFVAHASFKSPMRADIGAFSSTAAAKEYLSREGAQKLTWPQVFSSF